MAWAKFKFFWDKMLGSAGSTLTATSTAVGYAVENIYNMFETNLWKADSIALNTWIEQSNPKNSQLNSVTYGNGLYVAVGQQEVTDAYIVTSPDGKTWTERANPINMTLHGVAFGNGLFVAVGFADGTDAYIVTSPDGISWTERANPKNINLHTVVYGNGLFIAVGNVDGTDAYIVTSPNGITWTERANPKNIALVGVTYGNGLYVAAGNADGTDAYIVTSPDGITWTERANPKNIGIYRLIYAAGLYVAVGLPDGTDAYIVTSPDGITWTERANPQNIILHNVAYDNGLFMAAGGDGASSYIITSPDAITWTQQTSPKNFGLIDIISTNNLFVAVGYSDGADAYIIIRSLIYITYDAGSGNTKQADYLILYLTNLATIGATVTLQYSIDNFAADINDAFAGEAVTSDTFYIKRFTSPAGKRYWRLKITGTLSAAPFITLGIWGMETELDYCSASFDPHKQSWKGNINRSVDGYVTGIHENYIDRKINLQIADSDSTLYNKLDAWWEGSGVNLFFVAWNFTDKPTEIWLMWPEPEYDNPFKAGGLYRDININLIGRKVT